MFSREKPEIHVMKAYFLPSDTNEAGFARLLDTIFPALSRMKPEKYSINYGRERPVSKLLNDVRLMSFGELEYFDIVAADGSLLVTIGRPFPSATNLLQLMLVGPNGTDLDLEARLFQNLSDVMELQYGYVRNLRADYLPTTERKLKRSLFGNVTTEVIATEDDWLISPGGVRGGAIKGFYPLNYWQDAVLQKITQMGIVLPSGLCIAKNLYLYGPEQQLSMIARNPQVAKYLRFGAN
jgi:hypothetical protein